MARLLIRSVGSIIASVVIALLLILAIEGVSAIFHPFSAGADASDLEVCKAHVAKYPQWVLALVVVGWGGTVFVSAWLATRLGTHRHPAHGIVVGALLIVAVAFNMFMLPYPLWFKVANLLIFPLCVFLGIKFGRGRKSNQRDVSQTNSSE